MPVKTKTYTKLVITAVVPETEVVTTKTVLPKTKKTETRKQRGKRLDAQSAGNKSRIVSHTGNVYHVSSQRRDERGKPVETHEVHDMGNGLYVCSCQFGVYQPGVECTHIRRVVKYQKRNGIAPKIVGMSISEQLTEQWIARSRQERRARRTEWEEEV